MISRAARAAALAGVALASAASPQTVRPTSAAVPANLLRLSIAFEEPPSGPVLPRLALVTADGRTVGQPFLDQELWSPDGRILTVLMHPGRVKTGLVANETLGRALAPGERVTVTLNGRPLRTWVVTPPDSSPPDPARWTASAPRAGTRDPITVRLDGQVDAFDGDLVAIRAPDGARLPGRARLVNGETEWTFTPDTAWARGRYSVVAAPTLEDPSGNRPGSAFEHPLGAEDGLAAGPTFEVGIRGRPEAAARAPAMTPRRRR